MAEPRWVAAVREFHEAVGAYTGTTLAVPPEGVCQLRFDLIREEASEVLDAIATADLPGVAKELADLVVVTVGCALAYGVDLDAVFEEVHRTNMAKVGGPVRADGKVLKPPGWSPPDVPGVLAKQG